MSAPTPESKTIDFGFKEVDPADKTGLVGEVFDTVADRYDVMNDLMSVGVHRLWKSHFVAGCHFKPGDRLLDLAGGTGDIAKLALRQGAQPIVADINASMLKAGQRRMDQRGLTQHFHWLNANAERLPLASDQFDHITIVFGFRNVTHRDQALDEMYRVLKPGGWLHIMEFAPVSTPGLAEAYDAWSFKVLPWLGQRLTGSAESYRYLAESIRRFPDQATLAAMLEHHGFVATQWRNLSGGICAIHRAQKPERPADE
ncbi:MAG: class I SAM-dependent methyltransferase [Wenzhouxiangella sp.]|nr:class I SAM-dependent methyltransferase [Wenzhouxiangella sp.]